jgi:DNA mismatch repair protein MutL
MGRDVAESMIRIDGEDQALSVAAYLSPPDLSRGRGDRLYVYVNNRNIRDRLVTKAIIEGYGQRLMKGRYPQAAVFISMDHADVDVNVHPAKQEVRFHNGSAVYQAIASLVSGAFGKPSYAPRPREFDHEIKSSVTKRAPSSVSEAVWQYVPTSELPPERPSEPEQSPRLFSEIPKILGQLGNTYILCETEEGLLLVDQHAAHERIVYEKLKKGRVDSGLSIQRLLVPVKIELSVKETNKLLDKLEAFQKFGLELAHFGGNAFLLRSVPTLMDSVDWHVFLPDLISNLDDRDPSDDSLADHVLTVMACHGALRAGHHLTEKEMVALLRELSEMDLPTNCPHGRPVFKRMSYYEIEKMFKRVV